jgi:hypothetical protein
MPDGGGGHLSGRTVSGSGGFDLGLVDEIVDPVPVDGTALQRAGPSPEAGGEGTAEPG